VVACAPLAISANAPTAATVFNAFNPNIGNFLYWAAETTLPKKRL
jgi:hypothetical protein